MSMTEEERVRQIMENHVRGDQTGAKLVWNPETKMIEAIDPTASKDPKQLDQKLIIEPSDMIHFTESNPAPIIILSAEMWPGIPEPAAFHTRSVVSMRETRTPTFTRSRRERPCKAASA